MPALNYAQAYSQALVQAYPYVLHFAALRSTENDSRYRWTGANTIQIPSLTTTGRVDADRDTIGVAKRNFNNAWEPKTLSNHRKWSTLVHPLDIDETNQVASIQNITKVFNEEQKFPEMDAYLVSKLFREWTTAGGTADTTALTEETILTVFDRFMVAMDEANVPKVGRILYVTPAVKSMLKNAKELTRFLQNGDAAGRGAAGSIQEDLSGQRPLPRGGGYGRLRHGGGPVRLRAAGQRGGRPGAERLHRQRLRLLRLHGGPVPGPESQGTGEGAVPLRQPLPGYLPGGGLMVRVKWRLPMDYRLCNQTVTLYHWDGQETVTRRVIEKGAFLDFKKVQDVSKTGSREVNSFLLVIPCMESPVQVGDKVLLGKGPELSGREDWSSFLPAKVPGLAVVKYVDPKYWQGRMVHVEAGG